jgi:hypothetical protein
MKALRARVLGGRLIMNKPSDFSIAGIRRILVQGEMKRWTADRAERVRLEATMDDERTMVVVVRFTELGECACSRRSMGRRRHEVRAL